MKQDKDIVINRDIEGSVVEVDVSLKKDVFINLFCRLSVIVSVK